MCVYLQQRKEGLESFAEDLDSVNQPLGEAQRDSLSSRAAVPRQTLPAVHRKEPGKISARVSLILTNAELSFDLQSLHIQLQSETNSYWAASQERSPRFKTELE